MWENKELMLQELILADRHFIKRKEELEELQLHNQFCLQDVWNEILTALEVSYEPQSSPCSNLVLFDGYSEFLDQFQQVFERQMFDCISTTWALLKGGLVIDKEHSRLICKALLDGSFNRTILCLVKEQQISDQLAAIFRFEIQSNLERILSFLQNNLKQWNSLTFESSSLISHGTSANLVK